MGKGEKAEGRQIELRKKTKRSHLQIIWSVPQKNYPGTQNKRTGERAITEEQGKQNGELHNESRGAQRIKNGQKRQIHGKKNER